jgi:hypothetical protein
MVEIGHIIGELLLRHNCVIIPSFGGFVAKQTSAVIDYSSGIMTPPKKSLLFNRLLINNDGLLIAEVSKELNISYDGAVAAVQSVVAEWNAKLSHGERIVLETVGFLFADLERNICFEQDRFFNLRLESYGLGKVYFISEDDVKYIEHSQRKEVVTPVLTIVKDEPQLVTAYSDKVLPSEEIIHPGNLPIETISVGDADKKARHYVWRYVAAACFLPIAFYSFWIPAKTNVLESGMLSIRDFNPFHTSNKGEYKKQPVTFRENGSKKNSLEAVIANLSKDSAVYHFHYDENLIMPVRLEKVDLPSLEENNDARVNQHETSASRPISVNTQQLERAADSKSKSSISDSGKLEYIVGSFENETNANNLVLTLKNKGIQAEISGKFNGLIRVSAGKATDEQALQKIIQKVNSLGFEGWISK